MNVIAIGEVVVDWLSLKPGETIFSATEFHRGLGGNCTNVAIGLHRLGTPVNLIGKIGADFHGEYLKLALAAEGIDQRYILSDERYPTQQCYMTTTADGEHHFRNWPQPHAADMLSPEELPMDLLNQADVLHCTGISLVKDPRRAAVGKAVELALAAGAVISLDAGFPTGADDKARSGMEKVMHQCHILKMNEFELKFWSQASLLADIDIETIGRQIFDRYQPMALLLTRASHGSLILTAKDTIVCPPLPVAAVSEVGAGDAYIAGVLSSLVQHLQPADRPLAAALPHLSAEQWRQCGLSGNIAGALTTLEHNAYAGMPTRRRLLSMMGKISDSGGKR
jgi:fructokinase